METRIYDFINTLFIPLPYSPERDQTRMKLIDDTVKRYRGYVAGGMNEEDAYNKALPSKTEIDIIISELAKNGSEKKSKPDKKKKDPLFSAVSSALWLLIVAVYFIISFKTNAWYITWVMFLIGGSLEGIIKAIFELAGGEKNEE